MKAKRILSCMLAIVIGAWFAPPANAQNSIERQEAQLAAAGQQAMARGDYTSARENFEKLEKLAPNVAEVHAALAAIAFKQRDYPRTVREVKIAQKLNRNLPGLGSLLGDALSEEGDFDEAIPYLKEGFEATSDHAVKKMCGLELMRDYSLLNRDSEAVLVAVEMNRLFPNDPEVLYQTGRVYGNRAYVVMEKLHNISPNSVWMLQAQAEANQSAENWPAAIVAYRHVLALDPNRPGIHYQLGRIYLAEYRTSQSSKDKEAAVRQFTEELKTNPANADASYELANIEKENGNLSVAGEQFSALLKNVPDFDQALVALAGIDLALGKAAEAAPLLERAIRIRPDDEVAWWQLSRAYRAVGNRKGQANALAKFQKLHVSAASNPANAPSMDAVTPQRLPSPAIQ